MATPSALGQAAAESTHVSFFRDWGTRLQQLRDAGLDTNKVTPVIQNDWKKVLAGQSPMTGQEAGLAALAVAKGQPVLPSSKPQGLNLNPFHDIGVIGRDVGGIARGLTQQFVAQPIEAGLQTVEGHPGEAWKTLTHGWDPETAAAVGLEGLAKVADVVAGATGVGAAAIPGIEAAAGAGSAALMAHQGVKAIEAGQLSEHPVGTLLQFLPGARLGGEALAGVAGRAGAFGIDPKVVEGKLAEIEQAKIGARTPADDLTRAESAYQAAQAGKPVVATYRALAPEAAKTYIEGRAEGLARKFHIDELTRRLNRATGRERRVMDQAYAELMKNVGAFLSGKGPEEDARLYQLVTHMKTGEEVNLDPETRRVVQAIRDFQQGLAQTGVEAKKLYPITVGDKIFHFATEGEEGKIAQLHRMKGRAHDMLARRREAFSTEHQAMELERGRRMAKVGEARGKFEATRAKEQARLEGLIADANRSLDYHAGRAGGYRNFQKAMDRLAEHKATLAGMDSWIHLHPDAAALREAEASLADVRNRVAYQKAGAALQAAKKRSASLTEEFDRRLAATAPVAMHPVLEDELKAKAGARLAQKAKVGEITSRQLEAGMAELEQGYSSHFTPKEWKDLRDEVQGTWLELVKAGYDPVWIHTVAEGRENISRNPLSERYLKPAQLRLKVFDLTPRYATVAMGLTQAAAEYIRQASVERVLEDHIMPTVRKFDEVNTDLDAQIKKAIEKNKDPRATPDVIRSRIIRENYVEWDPARYGMTAARGRAVAEKLWVPKHVDEAFSKLLPKDEGEMNPLKKFGQRTTGILRASLFFQPRHMSHVLLGGAFAMMARGGPEEIMNAVKAFRMVKSGEVPPEIPLGLNEMSTDQIWHLAAGEKAGHIMRRLSESKVAGWANTVAHTEEFIANVERVMGYLGEEQRGVRAGYTEGHARELALEHVHKTFVDWDGLTPLERTLIRQCVPFYSFTKYVMRYLLTYPMDHPVRAAVISHLAENEQKDWNSGLPQSWQNLMFVGVPDKNGNVAVSDIKSINPFRDVGNFFSVSGLVMGLHPAIKTGLQALGVNTMTASGEMYPQVDFDPVTNRLVTKRPAMGMQALEQFIPPVAGLDHFFGFTADMRRLKGSDPQAYRRQLFSSLGIPFVDYSVSPSLELARHERAQYTVAKNAVDAAMKGGDLTALEQTPWVPTPSDLNISQSFVPGAALAQLVRQLEAAAPGVAPKAVIPKRRVRRA